MAELDNLKDKQLKDSNSIAGFSQDELDALLFGVLELPTESRSSWLETRCEGNSALIEEILSLAMAHEDSGNFLKQSLTRSSLQPSVQIDYSGRQLGSWELLSIVGQGGMGTVYKAKRCDGNYNQTVAVKVGPAMGLQSDLFKRERQVLADLSHPVITKILDAGDVPDSSDAYLVMEYIDGMPFTEYIDKNPSLSKYQRASLICDLLEALHQAHSQGVIHCDIKPDNVLIDNNGTVRLLDFGISRSIRETVGDGENPLLQGITPAYASPQRLTGASPTVADDIYSVGLVFGLTMPDADIRISNDGVKAIELISEFASRLNGELKSIFIKATADEVDDRYPSSHAFLEDIRHWMLRRPVKAHTGGPGYRIGKLFSRHRFLSISAILFAAVLGTTGFSWHLYNQKLQHQQAREEQVAVAIQLSKQITEDLDLRLSQLPGSLPLRLATAETSIQQIAQIHQQQPNNAQIIMALAQAKLQLQALYFQPMQMHIGEINESYENLSEAYNLAYEGYHLEPTVKNLMILTMATGRVTEISFIVNKNWSATSQSATDLIDKFNSYKVKDSVSSSTHRAKLFFLFRIQMLKKQFTEARDTLDTAMEISSLSKEYFSTSSETVSNYEKKKFSRLENRMMILNALFYMGSGDHAVAKNLFHALAERLENHNSWRMRREAMFAYQSIACINLQASRPDYTSALLNLYKAKDIAVSLSSKFPSAVNLQWELHAFYPLDQLKVEIEQLQNSKMLQKHAYWEQTFECLNPVYLHTAAPPPDGWEKFKQNTDLSLLSILKPL